MCPDVLQVFPSSSCYPRSENRTPDLHVGLVEGIHNGLDPVVVHLHEEHLDGLLGSRARRVGANSGRRSGRGRRGRGGGLVQQQELYVAAGDEAGDVVVEELVDALEVPAILLSASIHPFYYKVSRSTAFYGAPLQPTSIAPNDGPDGERKSWE